MTKEHFEREKNYRASLAITKSLLDKGIITEKNKITFNTKNILFPEGAFPFLGSNPPAAAYRWHWT